MRKNSKECYLKLKIISIWLLIPIITLANDADLGSIGGNVFPIFNKNKIRMQKEEINIYLKRDSSFVVCKFWFVNIGKKTADILMGFPDFMIDMSSESKPLSKFTCKVSGKDVDVEKFTNRMSPDAESTVEWYEKWYCWNIQFKPGDTILIENTYWGSWGRSVDGTCFFDYLIGTAKTWNGTIGSGKVVFDFKDVSSTLFADTSYSYYDSEPLGIQRSVYRDSIVFTYKNYYPEWDERLSVRLYSFWKSPVGNSEDTTFPYGEFEIDLRPGNYCLMRNEIFARHGYVFKDKELQQYFDKQCWYRRDPEFDFSKLSNYEKLFVGLLKKKELSVK